MDWKGIVINGSMASFLAASTHANLILSALPRPQIGLVRQSNIIVWNPETKVEHLVRSSAFISNAECFDFLTPTPTIPTVQPVAYHSFMSLFSLMHPPKKNRAEQIQPIEPLDPNFGTLIRKDVEVAKVTRIGNLVATTFRASDVIALSDWLKKNGYRPSAAQNRWLEKYVEKRWYLTAIKVASEDPNIETDAVRLSFKTNVPVNPYYAPEKSWLQDVWQELYVVSPMQLQGYVGAKTLLDAKPDSHAFMTTEAQKNLAAELKLDLKQIPKKAWVNRFVENGPATNTSDDIYFYPAPKGPLGMKKH